MFRPEFHGNDICHFADSLSEPKLLIDYINKTEDLIETQDVISLWENNVKSVTAEGIEITNPKSLYIVNSVYSGMMFCSNMYKEMKNIDKEVKISKNFKINRHTSSQELQYNDNYSIAQNVVLAFLNDDYQGGEINFIKQNIKIKPQAGSVLAFPSSAEFQYIYEPIVYGTRYLIPSFWT
jgi:hypothetical protein